MKIKFFQIILVVCGLGNVNAEDELVSEITNDDGETISDCDEVAAVPDGIEIIDIDRETMTQEEINAKMVEAYDSTSGWHFVHIRTVVLDFLNANNLDPANVKIVTQRSYTYHLYYFNP